MFGHLGGDLRIAQCDLVQHGAGHAGKMLLHTADAGAALPVGDVRHRYAANGDGAAFGRVQPQQQLEHGTLARAGAADQRDLLALFHGHREVIQHMFLAVAKGDVGKFHIAPGRPGTLCGNFPFRLGQKRINAFHARHGRLDGLNLHAQAFNGGENTRYVVDNGYRGADGHAEQLQHHRVAGGRQQHNDAHHHGVQQQHNGGVDGIVKVSALHGGVARADAPVIAAFHVLLHAQRADGADVVQRLGHLAGDGGHSPAVVQLSGQHAALYTAGKHRE